MHKKVSKQYDLQSLRYRISKKALHVYFHKSLIFQTLVTANNAYYNRKHHLLNNHDYQSYHINIYGNCMKLKPETLHGY